MSVLLNVDMRGNTALHHSAAAGFAKCVDHLLTSGAVATCKNSEGVAPIHYAAYHGHKDIVLRVLRHASFAADLRDSTGKTPLMLAAFRGRTQAVSALLSSSANVNIQDISGWTALMYAAFTGRIAICRELLEFAASRVIADFKTGKCAADLALGAGYYEVADMLQNKEVSLRTPSLPDGVVMPALRHVSRYAAGSKQSAGQATPLPAAANSSVLRPAIERALYPSLRRSPKTTSARAHRSAYTGPTPMKPPPIPPAPARPQSLYRPAPQSVPSPRGLNIVLPSSASAQRGGQTAITRSSNLAPTHETSSLAPSAAHSGAKQATLTSSTAKPRSQPPPSALSNAQPAVKPSTESALTPKSVKKDLGKQVGMPVRQLVRKSAHPISSAPLAANLLAATPTLPLALVAGPLHTPIVVPPERQQQHRTQPGSGWSQRGNPAPMLGQDVSKASSISDRVKETISRASLMYLDSRTSQALKREEAATLADTNRVAHPGLDRQPEAKYVSLGSAA
ncbi:Transient receptor putative cation channel sub A member 1, partial [Coemansia sp. RSA 2424]